MAVLSSLPPSGDDPPAEATTEHTRILRVMLVAADSAAYWRAAPAVGSFAERTRFAFEARWFGTKSEARVKTLMGDMGRRFDAFPAALEALRVWRPPADVAQWVCHFHTQLADPIYRRFTGEFLPARRTQGYSTVDRDIVARWMQQTWPERWSLATCVKFGGNLLATAAEAGVIVDRKDPRKLSLPRPPSAAVEYLLYLLRGVEIATPLLSSPYLRSVAPDAEAQADVLRSLRGVRVSALADVREITWEYPDLLTWVTAQKVAA